MSGISEARLDRYETGLAPTTEGWFVLNAREGTWYTSPQLGSVWELESPGVGFDQLGIRVTTLMPGQSHGFYHREATEENFLVLRGECLLLVEGQERTLEAWDFFHSAPGTEHVLVGAGDGPCAILMVGARSSDHAIVYPLSELAQGHDASVAVETTSPREAYAGLPEERIGHPPYWDELPWGGDA
jgi:uncharacterized cupin superfamily protein